MDFEDEIVARADGIRLTCLSRTVVDLTRYLGDDALASAVEHALSKGLCTIETLSRTAERMNTPGRPWVRRFLRILSRRTPGAACESESELRVHGALLARGVGGLVRQYRITLPGYGNARFDLAIPGIAFAVEIDVHPEHTTTEGIARDKSVAR